MYPIVILFSIIQLAFSQKGVLDRPQLYIKTTQLECKFDPEWIANVSCKVKPVSWEISLANVSFDIVKPLTNISVNVEIFRRETRFVPFLVNITKNVCDILSKKGMDFYGRFGFELGKRFVPTKLPTCPVTGHVDALNCYFETGTFHFMLISGVYLVMIKAFEGYPPTPLGYFKVTCIVGEKNRKT